MKLNDHLTYYKASEPFSGIAVLIFAGGGYITLSEHEDEGYARFFAQYGIDSFVYKYPLASDGYRHPSMIDGAMASMEVAREFLKSEDKEHSLLGVVGSSAGGHLAAHCLVEWERRSPELRPDFGVLAYAVTTFAKPYAAEQASRKNLIGEDAPAELVADLSMENRVNESTPPAFIWHTIEDQVVAVEHSIDFARLLRQHNVPFELHIYPRGEHGMGLETPYEWETACVRWMKSLME